MLVRFSELQDYKLISQNEERVGEVKDIYFDDASWTVRYLVVHPTTIAEKSAVLISPLAIEGPHATKRLLKVNLQHEHIRQSPDVEERLPISRQKEIELAEYYNWPVYWSKMAARVPGVVKELSQTREPGADVMEAHAEESPTNLRSADEMMRYNVIAKGEAVGHIDNFIVETEYWKLPLVAVDVAPLRAGHSILVPPYLSQEVRWQEKAIHLNVDAAKLKQAPYYDKTTEITEDIQHIYEQYFAMTPERS